MPQPLPLGAGPYARWPLTIVALIILVIILAVVAIREKMYSTLYNPSRKYKKRPEMGPKLLGTAGKPRYRMEGREYYLIPNDPQGRCQRVPTRPAGITEELVHVYLRQRYPTDPAHGTEPIIDPSRRVVLYFHGNSDNITARYFMATVCDILGLDLMLVEYRGYGKAPGTPSPYKIVEDAQTAYNFLHTCYDDENGMDDRIIVWGESLGGTPALYVAANNPGIHSLILLSTFSRLDKMLPPSYGGILNSFIQFACLDLMSKTHNAELAAKVKCKTLLIHSKGDTLIPYAHAEELDDAFSAGGCEHELVTIKGDHSTPTVTTELVIRIVAYLGVDATQRQIKSVTRILSKAIHPSISLSTSAPTTDRTALFTSPTLHEEGIDPVVETV